MKRRTSRKTERCFRHSVLARCLLFSVAKTLSWARRNSVSRWHKPSSISWASSKTSAMVSPATIHRLTLLLDSSGGSFSQRLSRRLLMWDGGQMVSSRDQAWRALQWRGPCWVSPEPPSSALGSLKMPSKQDRHENRSSGSAAAT